MIIVYLLRERGPNCDVRVALCHEQLLSSVRLGTDTSFPCLVFQGPPLSQYHPVPSLIVPTVVQTRTGRAPVHPLPSSSVNVSVNSPTFPRDTLLQHTISKEYELREAKHLLTTALIQLDAISRKIHPRA
jgi:hypothetical protein